MKLIELLVKELPKTGGWPEDAVTAIYFSHKKGVTFYDKDGMGLKNGVSFICMDIHGVLREEVTKEEFEAAIAKNDGLIGWSGGECSVDLNAKLDVKYLGGGNNINVKDGGQMWSHTRHFGDITAYRLHRDINYSTSDEQLEQDLNECIGQEVDVVNHPSHYTRGSVECIDAIASATVGKSGIEAVCVANAIKYLWRYEEKNGLEDVKKAQWYLNKLISEMENK